MSRYNPTSPARRAGKSLHRNHSMSLPFIVAGTVIAIAAVGVVGGSIAAVSNQETLTCTVESKDRAAGTDGTSTHRVYTDECGVLEVADNLFVGKFDSADRYAELKPGTTYNVKTIGWRIPLLSMFPNIIEATPVPES